jgi:hypothetical protein
MNVSINPPVSRMHTLKIGQFFYHPDRKPRHVWMALDLDSIDKSPIMAVQIHGSNPGQVMDIDYGTRMMLLEPTNELMLQEAGECCRW